MFPPPRPALVLTALLLAAPAPAQAPSAKELFAASVRSVAVVVTPERTATAVVVDADKKLLLTDIAAVGSRDAVEVVFPAIKGGELIQKRSYYLVRAKRIPARVVRLDSRRGLALLRVTELPAGAAALPLAEGIDVGAAVHAVGTGPADEAMWSHAAGTVRAAERRKITPKGASKEAEVSAVEVQLPAARVGAGSAVLNDRGELVALYPETAADPLRPYCTDATEIRGLLAEAARAAGLKSAAEYVARAERHSKANDYEPALADYFSAIELEPKSAKAWAGRGHVWLRRGDHERAVSDCTEALRLDAKLDGALADRGLARSKLGEHHPGVDDLTAAIRLRPGRASHHAARGLIHLRLRDWGRTVEDCTEALRLDPNDAMALNDRGIAHDGLNNYAGAVSDFTAALKLRTDDAVIHLNRGYSLLRQRKFAEALADANKAITLRPGWSRAYRDRGAMYASQNQHEKAVADYTTAIRLDPKDALAHLWRSLANQSLGHDERAAADYREALRLDPMVDRQPRKRGDPTGP